MPLKQRIPKLKGFTNPFRVEYSAVNLDTLERAHRAFRRRRVDPETLAAAGVVRRKACTSRSSPVGEADAAKLDVHAHAVSKAAEAAITAAGGTVTLVPLPFKGEGKAGRPAAQGNQFTNR